ncbi:MAG TPA: FAD-dependent oxidoreductase, partial [Candidatus Sulfotelmatobacter sp.]|nr:FAD-dependent oxidoreductase [Candidatus Sulfotelmatobacter sp.]
MEQARVVVIGGGITGCSVAYHLAEAGWTDVLLLEKGQLTSGATAHAAGLVTVLSPSATMMGFRRYSVELYRRLGVFDAVGSLRLASSPDQLLELHRAASRARALGLDAEVISPADVRRLAPALGAEDLFGAIHLSQDGHLDPHTTTHAVAAAGRALGVRIRTGVRVTGVELGPDRAVRRVHTSDGPIDTELVVDAAGLWGPQVAAMAGAFAPSTPVDHQHIALRAVPGHELPADMPCFRDPDNLVYGRSEPGGGMLFGGYEQAPMARWIDGVPWDHEARSLPPDMARFEPLLAGAIRRFPFLDRAEVVRLVCHPDAMTPDGNPLLGPMPGLRGFWVAAGLSLNGFGGGGGIGRTMAAWITTGEPDVDVAPYRAWRFGAVFTDPVYAADLARETYRYYYRLRYPDDIDEAGRPKRLSALHGRLQEAGTVFAVKHGWERPDRVRPGEAWRRAGPDQRAWGWGRPPYLQAVADEYAAVRQRVGLIDLSSFGKIEVRGPGALPLIQRIAANEMERPVGAVTYTQFLDTRGGMQADVTVTRLAGERFRIVTGAGYVTADLGWLHAHVEPADGAVELRDTSDAVACLGLWGPLAREVLGAATDDDVSDAALPARAARAVRVGGAEVLAARLSYAGELGWELYVPYNRATMVWDMLLEAGREFGIEVGGYKVLDALRLEKGYRYYTVDVTQLETPYEGGLGFCVDLNKKDFIGRAALAKQKAEGIQRKLCTLVLEGEDFTQIYGGEAVYHEGKVLSRVRSGGYG